MKAQDSFSWVKVLLVRNHKEHKPFSDLCNYRCTTKCYSYFCMLIFSYQSTVSISEYFHSNVVNLTMDPRIYDNLFPFGLCLAPTWLDLFAYLNLNKWWLKSIWFFKIPLPLCLSKKQLKTRYLLEKPLV